MTTETDDLTYYETELPAVIAGVRRGEKWEFKYKWEKGWVAPKDQSQESLKGYIFNLAYRVRLAPVPVVSGVHNAPHPSSCACIHCRLSRAEEKAALYRGLFEESRRWESIRNGDLVKALEDLVTRCDGAEGVRADGSNIDTLKAHVALGNISAVVMGENYDPSNFESVPCVKPEGGK